MKKEFVKAKIERCTHRKGAEAVKINDSFPKRLFNLNKAGENIDKLKEFFIIHEKDSSEFILCQLTVDAIGYNKLYIITANSIDEAKTAVDKMSDTIEFVDNTHMKLTLCNIVYHFVKNHILYEKSSI